MYVSKELALILKDRGFSKSFSSNSYYTTILSEEVVDWIFSEVSTRNYAKQGNVKWLQFWYTTLLDHNFGLMHEFIGRLEDWFSSNDYEVHLIKYSGTNQCAFSIQTKNTYDCTRDDWYDTKQQAKHEAILKCFELLKSDKDEE